MAALGWAFRGVLIVVVLVVALAALALATLPWYVSGEAGGPPMLVWLTATLVLSGAGGAWTWLIFPRHPRRTAAIAIFAVVGVAAGIAAGAVASVELPAGATLGSSSSATSCALMGAPRSFTFTRSPAKPKTSSGRSRPRSVRTAGRLFPSGTCRVASPHTVRMRPLKLRS